MNLSSLSPAKGVINSQLDGVSVLACSVSLAGCCRFVKSLFEIFHSCLFCPVFMHFAPHSNCHAACRAQKTGRKLLNRRCGTRAKVPSGTRHYFVLQLFSVRRKSVAVATAEPRGRTEERTARMSEGQAKFTQSLSE